MMITIMLSVVVMFIGMVVFGKGFSDFKAWRDRKDLGWMVLGGLLTLVGVGALASW